jgi:chromosome segregation ATPase
MPREKDELEEVATLMGQLNKNLEGIGEFRKRFSEVLEAVGKRMDVLEARIEGIQTGGVALGTADQEERLKTIEKEIEMTQVALDKIQTKEHIHKDLQESIENAVNYTEKVEKLAKKDNKYMEALDIELKSHIADTEERIKDLGKEIGKVSAEAHKGSKLKEALRELIRLVSEG